MEWNRLNLCLRLFHHIRPLDIRLIVSRISNGNCCCCDLLFFKFENEFLSEPEPVAGIADSPSSPQMAWPPGNVEVQFENKTSV
jgi:hypothetical protein